MQKGKRLASGYQSCNAELRCAFSKWWIDRIDVWFQDCNPCLKPAGCGDKASDTILWLPRTLSNWPCSSLETRVIGVIGVWIHNAVDWGYSFDISASNTNDSKTGDQWLTPISVTGCPAVSWCMMQLRCCCRSFSSWLCYWFWCIQLAAFGGLPFLTAGKQGHHR